MSGTRDASGGVPFSGDSFVYVRVSPTTVSDFSVATNLGVILTSSDFTNTGSYLECIVSSNTTSIFSVEKPSGYNERTITTTTSTSHGDQYTYLTVTFLSNAEPGGGDDIGNFHNYIRVTPTTIPDFTVNATIGRGNQVTLTKSDFTNAGNCLVYYAGNSIANTVSNTSASATGYDSTITTDNATIGGNVFTYTDVAFGVTVEPGTSFRVTPTNLKAFVIATNGGNFDQDSFTNAGSYLECYREAQQGYSITSAVAYGYTSSYTSSGGSGSDVVFDITFTVDPSVVPPEFNLYAWSNPNGLAPGSFIYTSSTQSAIGDPIYDATGTATSTVSTRTVNSTTGKVTSIAPPNAPLSWPRAKVANDIIVLPEYLYGYTDPNASGETLYAWTIDPEDIKNFSDEFPFSYIKDGQGFTIPDNTIYTKTPTVDTSTNVYYLVDGTELAITNIHFAFDDPYDSTGIVSADANSITINFER